MESGLEFSLQDWRHMYTAPKDCTWIEVKLKDGSVVDAHFAQDLSGEEQPAFSGWFRKSKSGNEYIEVIPVAWRPKK